MRDVNTTQEPLYDERFILVKDLPSGEQVEFARYPSFEAGWKASTHVVTRVDREGSYSLHEILPSGATRRRAKFAHARLMPNYTRAMKAVDLLG